MQLHQDSQKQQVFGDERNPSFNFFCLLHFFHKVFAEACSSPNQPLVMSYRALMSLPGLQPRPKAGVCLFLPTSKQVEGAAKYQFYRGAVFAGGCKQTAK